MLVETTRQAPGWLGVLVLAELGAASTTLLVPYVMSGAVDDVLAGHDPAVALGRLTGVLALEVVLSVLSVLATGYATAAATAWLRRRVLQRLVGPGTTARLGRPAGDLTSRLITDTLQTASLGPALVGQLVVGCTAVGGVLALWLIDWWLVVAFALGLPSAWLAVRLLVGEFSDLFEHYSRVLGEISGRLGDAVAGARTIHACGSVEAEVQRVLAPLPQLSDLGHRMWSAQRRTAVQLGLVVPVIRIAVLGTAGFGLADGRITAGQFVTVGSYVSFALGLLNLTEGLVDLAGARAGGRRLAEVLESPAAPVGTAPAPAGPGGLVLRSVVVHGVLHGVDLALPAGRCVAVVGRSGAGKTTLADVAGGLIHPDRGQALLDGVPVGTLAPGELRRAISYGFARPHLWGTTVADAIAVGAGHATPADVLRAAAIADADGFIRHLPQGYATPLADAPMSGGEVQRLGLARAVVGGPRVVILDDATSSLDTVTEARISAALTDRLAGHTRLIVTHRAGTAARADLVAWLERGRIRAVAPHRQLWHEPDYRAAFEAGAG